MRLLAHPSCLDDPSTSPASTHSPVVCSQALRLRASGCDVSAEVWTPWIWNLRQVTGCLGTFVIVLSWKTIVSFKIAGLSNLKKARFHKLPNRVGKLAQLSAEPIVSCVEPLGDEPVVCVQCTMPKILFARGPRMIRGSFARGSWMEDQCFPSIILGRMILWSFEALAQTGFFAWYCQRIIRPRKGCLTKGGSGRSIQSWSPSPNQKAGAGHLPLLTWMSSYTKRKRRSRRNAELVVKDISYSVVVFLVLGKYRDHHHLKYLWTIFVSFSSAFCWVVFPW